MNKIISIVAMGICITSGTFLAMDADFAAMILHPKVDDDELPIYMDATRKNIGSEERKSSGLWHRREKIVEYNGIPACNTQEIEEAHAEMEWRTDDMMSGEQIMTASAVCLGASSLIFATSFFLYRAVWGSI